MPSKTDSPSRKEKKRLAAAAKRTDETAHDFQVVGINLASQTTLKHLGRIKRRFARVQGESKRRAEALKEAHRLLRDSENARQGLSERLVLQADREKTLESQLKQAHETCRERDEARAELDQKRALVASQYDQIEKLEVAVRQGAEAGSLAKIAELETALGLAEQRLSDLRVQHAVEAQALGANAAAVNSDPDAKVFIPAPVRFGSDLAGMVEMLAHAEGAGWKFSEAILADLRRYCSELLQLRAVVAGAAPVAESVGAEKPTWSLEETVKVMTDTQEGEVFGEFATRQIELWLRSIQPLQVENARLHMKIVNEKRESGREIFRAIAERDNARATADETARLALTQEGRDIILRHYMDAEGAAFTARDKARRDLEDMTKRLQAAIEAGESLAAQLKEAKLAEQRARFESERLAVEGQEARDFKRKCDSHRLTADAATSRAEAAIASVDRMSKRMSAALTGEQVAKQRARLFAGLLTEAVPELVHFDRRAHLVGVPQESAEARALLTRIKVALLAREMSEPPPLPERRNKAELKVKVDFDTEGLREAMGKLGSLLIEMATVALKARDERLCKFILARAANFAKVYPDDLRLWVSHFHEMEAAEKAASEAQIATSNEADRHHPLARLFDRNFRFAFSHGDSDPRTLESCRTRFVAGGSKPFAGFPDSLRPDTGSGPTGAPAPGSPA